MDAPALLSCGKLQVYQDVLRRLLPLFIRLQKKNYVALVIYTLGALPQILQTDSATSFLQLLSDLSSEDLEIFHSLLRATSRYSDNHTQTARKALFLTARSSTALLTLQTWRDIASEVDQDTQRIRQSSISASVSSIEERYQPAVQAISEHIGRLFEELVLGTFEIKGEMEKLQGQKKKVGIYTLLSPSATAPVAPTQANNSKKAKTPSSPPTPPIIKIPETFLPPQLWKSTKIRLNTYIDISRYQSRPAPPRKSKRQKKKEESVMESTGERQFISTNSLDAANISSCGCRRSPIGTDNIPQCVNCKSLLTFVAEETLKWFVVNIEKEDDTEEDPDSDVNVS